MKHLQNALKSLLDQMDAIMAASGDAPLSNEQNATYKGLLGQAEQIRDQIDQANKAETIKAWAQAPDGQSRVKASFAREALPGEGEAPGLTAEPNGDMYAVEGIGEAKLKALKSGAYKDAFIQYIRAVGLGRGMKGDAMKVLNEGADTAGGFWVPPDYRNELIKKIATMAAVRPNASVYTTGSDVLSFPKVTYTTDDKYTSGARFSWQASTPLDADISEATNPVAGRENIPVHTATAAIILTREQLEDNSFDLLGYISMILEEAYSLGEEDAFLNGNGAGQPQGILSHSNATVADASGGMMILSGISGGVSWQSASGSEDSTKGLIGMEGALPPQYEENARWLAAKKTYGAIRGLVDSQKRPLWQQTDGMFQSWVRGYPATLLGYPIAKSQFMPALASNSYSVLFGDLRGYYIADRVGLSIEVLREIRALRGEVVVYARKRVGGQLVQDWRLKTLKAATS